MTSVKDTASFFANGTTKQFDYCLKLYPQVLKLKADARSKKPDELVRLDDWYQNELPKRIKQRGKDAHMVHEELVQTMKWKQSRGKFYPQLSYLVKVNTPRAVMQETKKAFKKLPNLEQAITALSNLKGVGTTMASALLAAAAPDSAPFMADECLMAIPEIEGIDYTTKEYLNFVQHIQTTVTRLNTEKDSTSSWSPHRVELALWTHYVATDLKPELLEDMPEGSLHNLSSKKFSSSGDEDGDEDEDDEGNGVTTTTIITAPKSSITKQTNGSVGAVATDIGDMINNDTDDTSISNDSQDDDNIMTTGIKSVSVVSGDGNLFKSKSTVVNNECVDSIITENSALTNINTITKISNEQKNHIIHSSIPSALVVDEAITASSTIDDEAVATPNTIEASDESNLEPPQLPENGNSGNGAPDILDDSTRSEDSLEKPIKKNVGSKEINDSDSYRTVKRSLDCENTESNSQPELKKIRSD